MGAGGGGGGVGCWKVGYRVGVGGGLSSSRILALKNMTERVQLFHLAKYFNIYEYENEKKKMNYGRLHKNSINSRCKYAIARI
jgi:hypothetical protein